MDREDGVNSEFVGEADFAGPRVLRAAASSLYSGIVSARNKAYDNNWIKKSESRFPILCAGNVTVGGNGKTPFTLFLASEYIEQGLKPVILSRGYRGKKKGPHLVTGRDSAQDVGDEALLYFKSFGPLAPVVVSRDRAAGARYIEKNQIGNIILLDDGFQHRQLGRDLNILLLDVSNESATNKWLNGKLLPLGYLREPLSTALARCNCVVFIIKGDNDSARLQTLEPYQRIPKDIPSFTFHLTSSHFVDAYTDEEIPLSRFRGTKVFGLSAIASPQQFFDTLTGLGLNLRGSMSFRDHHSFSQKDWDEVRSKTQHSIVVTTKDAVKLKKFVKCPGQLFVLNQQGRFANDAQKRKFFSLLEKKSPPELSIEKTSA